MTTAIRGALCCAVVGLLSCGGSASNASLAGTVSFSDGSDASGLTVTLLGPVGQQVTTSGGGAWSFDKLPAGVYLVSVEAPDSRENRLSFGAQVKDKDAITAPDLVFTPVCSLTGKVNDSGGVPAAGVTVALSGSDRIALTDAAGSYQLSGLAAGSYVLVAKAPGVLAQQASAPVMVKRGKNDAPLLTLANDLTATGKLEGSVFFLGGDSPKDVKLSVADISALSDVTGFFSLALPPGDYDLFAESAGYPKQTLGHYEVRSGQTTTVPPYALTLFKSFKSISQIYSANWLAFSEGSDFAVARVYVNADYSYENYLVNTKTLDRKLLFIGSANNPVLSKLGKWFAFQTSASGVVAINTGSGAAWSFAGVNIIGPMLSADENTMFFWSQGQALLFRVDLNSGAATTFPAFGGGSFFQTPERFLARTTGTIPFDVQLITSSSAATVFTQMQANVPAVTTSSGNTNLNAVAYAYTCAAACNVQVLGPTATTASQVLPIMPAAPNTITGSVKDWLGLSYGGVTPGRVLVKVADGSSTPLPVNISQLLFNETVTRVATYSNNLVIGGFDVREDAVPPSATSTILMNAPIVSGAWLSPTRFTVFGNGVTPKKLDVKSGVPSAGDTDIVYDTASQQSPLFAPPGVMWVKATTMKRMGAAYDSADFPVDTLGGMSSFNFSGVGSRSAAINSVMGQYAAFSDRASLLVFDGVKGEARKSPGNFQATSNFFVPTDRYGMNRYAGYALQYFQTGKVVVLSEQNTYLSGSGIGTVPKSGATAAVCYSVSTSGNDYFLQFATVP